jgi:hypothetical protein
MPAQRQKNSYPHTAMLTEVRDVDGTLFPACDVGPGESVDWPRRLTGFTGWVEPEAEPAATLADSGTETLTPPAASAGSAKSSRGKAQSAAPAESAEVAS